jgi:multiple sugar transport system permease protein
MNGKNRKPIFWIWAFLFPTIVLYGIYTLYPVGATFWYSLLDWNGFSMRGTFVGFENYRELFRDDLFWNSLKNTFVFLVYAVPGRFFLSLFLALIVNAVWCPAASTFRTIIFIPVVTTGAIIGTIMNMIFDPSNGPINLMLARLGLIDHQIFFLGDTATALATSSIIWIWKWTGTSLIYWIASLQSIPLELYEAATIDGAGAWQRFRYITAPLLVPFGAIILIITLSDAMRVFDLMLTLTGGGPFFRTEVIELFIYRQAFTSSVPRIGYASAAATIFGFIFIVLTLIQLSYNKFGKRRVA